VDIIRDLAVMIIWFLMLLFFVRAIVSWLFVFGVRNEVLLQINAMLAGITEPILAPIRRYVPAAGGLDLSFLVAVFGLWFIRRVLISL
jgi:YggT family protein